MFKHDPNISQSYIENHKPASDKKGQKLISNRGVSASHAKRRKSQTELIVSVQKQKIKTQNSKENSKTGVVAMGNVQREAD